MIGLSVSLCISRMVRGDVDPSSVEKIVAGTRADSPEAWNRVIGSYRRTYWHNAPDEAEAILRQFIADGKVVQPRLENSHHYPLLQKQEIFVDSEEQIIWADERYED